MGGRGGAQPYMWHVAGRISCDSQTSGKSPASLLNSCLYYLVLWFRLEGLRVWGPVWDPNGTPTRPLCHILTPFEKNYLNRKISTKLQLLNPILKPTPSASRQLRPSPQQTLLDDIERQSLCSGLRGSDSQLGHAGEVAGGYRKKLNDFSELNTRSNGRFAFHRLDISSRFQVASRKPSLDMINTPTSDTTRVIILAACQQELLERFDQQEYLTDVIGQYDGCTVATINR